jgi:hypothetical protein
MQGRRGAKPSLYSQMEEEAGTSAVYDVIETLKQ